ncbi:MAG TPA: hypothetical protein VEI54_00040 [Candidatus Limnocylindrales bacterium]|nr:hypothetical protein [Candidatus Limnocylindrales bacterium]
METIVPANFPEELAATAFVNGEEAAWEQEDCLAAIGWLSKNGYAVLGFELWLPEDRGIRTAISTKAGPAIYVSSCDPKKGETWENYVQRSAREAAEHIGGFRWPEDSLEQPRPAYFNLTWADRNWIRNSEGKWQTYF